MVKARQITNKIKDVKRHCLVDKSGIIGIGKFMMMDVFWMTGRVKNPDFIDQVLEVCNKDDHLVTVSHSKLNQKSEVT